jgi:hypothetical protein
MKTVETFKGFKGQRVMVQSLELDETQLLAGEILEYDARGWPMYVVRITDPEGYLDPVTVNMDQGPYTDSGSYRIVTLCEDQPVMRGYVLRFYTRATTSAGKTIVNTRELHVVRTLDMQAVDTKPIYLEVERIMKVMENCGAPYEFFSINGGAPVPQFTDEEAANQKHAAQVLEG